ncbi:hypothetical protein FB107DRAFT_289718 [Schizophyllum commune]
MSSGIVRKFRTRYGVSTLVVFPKTQDAIDRPEEWNRQWEEFYQHPDFPGPTQLVNGYRGIRNPRANLDFFFFSDLLEQTRHLHRHFLKFCRHQAFVDAFSKSWLRAKPEDRKQHALNAIANVCGTTDNINNARAYCPEILTMNNLVYEGDGVGFIHLLERMRHTDISVRAPHEICTYSPQWDKFLEEWGKTSHTQIEELCLAEVMGLRFKMLCWIVLYTTFSFLGLSLPKINVTKERYPKGDETAARTLKQIEVLERAATVGELAMACGDFKEADERFRQYERDHRKMMAGRRVACARCLSFQDESEERFKRCVKCWEQKRDVSYCSRKCQVEDWKSGRHKIVCGKAIDMQTARIYSDTRPRESLQRDPEEPIPEREWKEVMRLYKILEPTLDLD